MDRGMRQIATMVTYNELKILYSWVKFSFKIGDSLKTNLQQIKKAQFT